MLSDIICIPWNMTLLHWNAFSCIISVNATKLAYSPHKRTLFPLDNVLRRKRLWYTTEIVKNCSAIVYLFVLLLRIVSFKISILNIFASTKHLLYTHFQLNIANTNFNTNGETNLFISIPYYRSVYSCMSKYKNRFNNTQHP